MQSSDAISRSSEIGSLIAHSNDESQFVGSSSGVFFVNTVRQAFAKSLGPLDASPTPAPEFPAPEDTIVGPPKSPRVKQNAAGNRETAEPRGTWAYDPHVAHLLGKAPALEDARRLMMMYFKLWHPLFPFLHGPSFLQAMEAFYSESTAVDGEFSSTISEHRRACWTTILQCVFNISIILQPDIQLAQQSKITSAASALKLVDVLVNRHDILSLQALLALQLYLVATMSLRNASLLGGAILRSILHAGFHRCPYRYQQLNSHDCQLRKRIFCCFYAIDRYLSQALGLPLGIQDSDIDVCLPGVLERHIVGNFSSTQPASPSRIEKTLEQATNIDTQDNSMENTSLSSPKSPQKEQLDREATLAGYVMYGRLTGRALELFHKSIQNREVRRSAVLYLVSDVHKWWNNLPSTLQGTNKQSAIDPKSDSHNEESPFDLSPFFSILYEHLILCINRPCLSLEPSSADFCSGLQICISSARNILSLLKTQLVKGQALFWPGLLSAAYMAGLVIAFACQLGQYSLSKGCQ
jgi:Fungal specific transcription factor domain